MTPILSILAACLGALFLAAPPPAPALTCDYCGMLIEQPRFGGRMQTLDRQTLRFDATECMAAFTIRPRNGELAPVAMWSVRWDRPGAELDARKAVYLHSESLPSPMGLHLSAFPDARAAAAARAKHPGRLLDWDQVVGLVRERWFQPARH